MGLHCRWSHPTPLVPLPSPLSPRPAAAPNGRQPLGQLALETAVRGAIVLALDAEIVLGGHRVGRIVGVLIAFAVAKPLSTAVVGIAEMDRHGQQAALSDLGPGPPMPTVTAFDFGAQARYVTA